MPFDRLRILEWPVPVVHQRLTVRDTILYALSVGIGHDPIDEQQLPFVNEADLRATPTMATVLAHPNFWMRDPATGIDWERVVHGEQGMRIHRRLPVEADLIGTTRVTHVVDKGPEKGALVYQERHVVGAEHGEPLCTLTKTTFCRGDGGCGGPTSAPGAPLPPVPDREPDFSCDVPTLLQSALLFRLFGDTNPLHVDPEVARRAGFERPILHGLGTFGVAGHAILRTLCDYDPTRLTAMDVRFSAPLVPGETVRTEMWRDGDTIAFRALSVETGLVVLDRGRARVDGSVTPGD